MSNLTVYKPEEDVKTHSEALAEYSSEDALGHIINSQADFDEASDIINEIKSRTKYLKTAEKNLKQGALDTVAQIRDLFRPVLDQAEAARGIWDEKIKSYLSRVELQQVEVRKALQEAVHSKDTAAVSKGLDKLAAKAKAEGVSVVKVWKWRILNKDIVPTEFTSVDATLIELEKKRQVDGGVMKPYIAGIEFFRDDMVKATG